MLGTLQPTSDGRFSVHFELALAHPRALVWHVITKPEPLSCWFPARVKFELAPGAELTFKPTPAQIERFGVSPDHTGSGRVTQVNPPELLEFSWSGELIRWELDDDGAGGCLLTFTNTFSDRSVAAKVAAGWHAGLEILQATLDGRKPTQSMWERSDELTRDYALTMG